MENRNAITETTRYVVEFAANEIEVDVPVDMGRHAAMNHFCRAAVDHLGWKNRCLVPARMDREYDDGRGGIFLTYIMEPDDKSGWIGGDVWFDAYPAPCA